MLQTSICIFGLDLQLWVISFSRDSASTCWWEGLANVTDRFLMISGWEVQ